MEADDEGVAVAVEAVAAAKAAVEAGVVAESFHEDKNLAEEAARAAAQSALPTPGDVALIAHDV